MSPPPTPPPPVPAKPAPTAARWLDRLATALLAGSVGVTVATTVSALLVAAGVDLPESPWTARTPPDPTLPHGPPGSSHHPPAVPGHPSSPSMPDDPEILGGGLFDPDHDLDPDDAPVGQLGLARGPLTLREQPTTTADVVGEVKAGEQVTIPLIVGDWALVVYRAGAVTGWTKKSGIAIR